MQPPVHGAAVVVVVVVDVVVVVLVVVVVVLELVEVVLEVVLDVVLDVDVVVVVVVVVVPPGMQYPPHVSPLTDPGVSGGGGHPQPSPIHPENSMNHAFRASDHWYWHRPSQGDAVVVVVVVPPAMQSA